MNSLRFTHICPLTLSIRNIPITNEKARTSNKHVQNTLMKCWKKKEG